MSPVVFTFDDASPEQFRYIQKPDGTLEIDSTSGIGIWLAFHREHPDWPNRATFCLLPGANAGHNFFGNGGIQGQKTAWRFKKVQFLAAQGFELCDHTLWHAQLNKYPDAFVQEQIARGQLAIDSAVPGYHVRTFALPQGLWPKNRDLAHEGAWHDVHYKFDAILEVAGPPAPSPYDPAFNPLRMPRIQAFGNAVDRMVEDLDRTGSRYVAGQ
jgi:Polysaccharide deacetylase